MGINRSVGRVAIMIVVAVLIAPLAVPSAQAAETTSLAESETSVYSTLVSGTFADTQTSDDVYETLRERRTRGKPAVKQSQLDHQWSFTVQSGDPVTFSVEAYRSANDEGDDFEFSFSADAGANWTTMVTVANPTDTNVALTYVLPTGTAGSVLIRAEDTDHTDGSGDADFLYIDAMSITSEGDPPPNNNPIAIDDTATTDINTPITIPVLTNDSDPDNDPITIQTATQGTNGTTTHTTTTITYTPNTNYVGTDTLTYTITDDRGGTATATVTITTEAPPPNNNPIANNDTATTDINTPITIPVLDNDSDPDNDPITIQTATQGTNGTTTHTTTTITYTPNTNYVGTDTLTYTITDDRGGTATATVTITTEAPPPNNNPIANNDTATTDTNTPITIPVLDNDSDPDNDPITIQTATQGTNGTTTHTTTTITYTPNTNYVGTDTLTYTITDDQGATATATVTVTTVDVPTNTVTAFPGDNLAAIAVAAGEGATIILSPGTYTRQSIVPLANQTFSGYGAVMDGKNAKYAFVNSNQVVGVTIEGVEVKKYRPGKHHGAIDFRSTDWFSPDFQGATNWVLRDVYSHHNNGDGIFAGDGAKLYDVVSNNNKWLGLGAHGIDIEIIGGEFAYNSTSLTDQQVTDHAGGMKITKAQDILISDVHVHDNFGPGIWIDVSVIRVEIANSLITDNQRPGVQFEISYDGNIHDNIFLRNGLTDPNFLNDPWVWGASVSVRTSRSVHVVDNFIADSGAGVIIVDMPHRGAEKANVQAGMQDPREYAAVDNVITGNVIVETGRAGAAVGGTDPTNRRVFTENTINYNSYVNVDYWWENEDGPPFWGRSYTWAEWQAVGNDLNGVELSARPPIPNWP